MGGKQTFAASASKMGNLNKADTHSGELIIRPKHASLTMNILFVCSMNKWRSPTGEVIFQRHDGVNTRSAGKSHKARRRVNVTDIRWADLICVMEEKHLSRLRVDFRGEVKRKTIHVLDIPDDYQFMDPALIDLTTRDQHIDHA